MGSCEFCGKPAQGNYAVHRDGFGVGPEVDLCDECGSNDLITLADIWEKLAQPAAGPFAFNRDDRTAR